MLDLCATRSNWRFALFGAALILLGACTNKVEGPDRGPNISAPTAASSPAVVESLRGDRVEQAPVARSTMASPVAPMPTDAQKRVQE